LSSARSNGRIDIAAVEQNVAAADQFDEARACVLMVRIERNTRLVEIEKRKPRTMSCRRQRRGVAKRIALRRLDLVNGGAEISQQTRAIARCSTASDLDNPQMRQRAHRFLMPITSA
jgi:hypothetical protein